MSDKTPEEVKADLIDVLRKRLSPGPDPTLDTDAVVGLFADMLLMSARRDYRLDTLTRITEGQTAVLVGLTDDCEGDRDVEELSLDEILDGEDEEPYGRPDDRSGEAIVDDVDGAERSGLDVLAEHDDDPREP